ncbi:hypothetical protein, partial [Helicobacter sp. UBA3407]|uniref:hypothetical protein n=1 Tax=Helicobacter sp. UBA3407 TaxID=1946588 RepID=UPI00262A30EF
MKILSFDIGITSIGWAYVEGEELKDCGVRIFTKAENETTKDTKSPYELRTLALSQKLDSKDLARVILHIAKHRGYGNKHAKTG